MNSLDTFDAEVLLNNLKCTTCGSYVFDQNCNCTYCNSHNVALDFSLHELDRIIKESSYGGLTPNIIFLCLNESKINLPSLKYFLEQNNIKNKIRKLSNLIYNKILNSEKLTQDEENCFISLLKYNGLIKKEKNQIINMLIINIMSGKKLITKECFTNVIQEFVKDIMIEINHNRLPNYEPICEIEEFNGKIYASAANGKIMSLSSELINKLYNGEIEFLQTLFHELYHIKQMIEIKTGKINSEVMTNIKEMVIKIVFPEEFYQDNYNINNMEIDADINGFIWFKRYVNQLGFSIDEERLQAIISKLAERKNNHTRNTSRLDGVNTGEMSFEDVFLKGINQDLFCMKVYPALNIAYTIDHGMVRAKTKEELKESLSHYQNEEAKGYILSLIAELEQEENLKRGS